MTQQLSSACCQYLANTPLLRIHSYQHQAPKLLHLSPGCCVCPCLCDLCSSPRMQQTRLLSKLPKFSPRPPLPLTGGLRTWGRAVTGPERGRAAALLFPPEVHFLALIAERFCGFLIARKANLCLCVFATRQAQAGFDVSSCKDWGNRNSRRAAGRGARSRVGIFDHFSQSDHLDLICLLYHL